MDGSYNLFSTGTAVSFIGPLNILDINSANYNLKQKNIMDLFYLINISIMEAIEHYTNIINHVAKD